MVLYQDVTLPSNFPCVLSLIYYYKNLNDDTRPQPGFFNPPSLIDIDNPRTSPNQQLRIDIMTSTSEPFSVESKDVLENLFNTPPGTPLEKGYTTLTADLSKYAGQTIRLRFACADNLYFLLFGIDDVVIKVRSNDAALKAFSRFSPIKPQRGY